MQPSQFPVPFDAQGNMIIPGIKSPSGLWSLDASGSLVVHDITLNASDIETGITLHGSDIDPELYNRKERGLIALTQLANSSAAYNGTQILIGKIVIPAFDATRQYALGGSALHFDKQAVTGFTRLTLFAYLKYDADATTADTSFWQEQWLSDSTSGSDWIVNFRHPFNDTSPSGTDLHISLYFSTNVSNAAGLICAGNQSPGARIYVEDVGEVVDYGTFDLSTGVPPTQTYTKTYSANGSASFQGDGTNRVGFDGGHCYQGQYSSTNGNQFSCITFPYSTIQADLAGATIVKTEVYLNNLFWYNNSGGTAVIGTHTFGTVTGNANYANVTPDINETHFDLGQAKWVTVNNSIGNAFKNNTAKGIALGKGPSTSKTYYGYFAGNGQTGEPQLRITYTK